MAIIDKKEIKVLTTQDILDARMKKLEKKGFKRLIQQIEKEYQLSWDHMKPKWDEWELRLKLYNNQKRDKEAVGDPLLFTIQQTVLASLYADRLTATFEAREDGDEDRAEITTSLAEFDYDEMEKDEIDYMWDWDTLFFGRGLLLLKEFDKKISAPVPEVIDPMTFLRDPFAKSARGDRKGRGALQFCGWEASLTKREIESARVYFNTKDLKGETMADRTRSPHDRNVQARQEAQGLGNTTLKSNSLTGDNKKFKVLNWFTWYQGKLVFVTLAENRKKIIRFEELKDTTVPIIDRSIFPISHDWDGVSIPDIVEDKQRARSVIQNLTLKSAKLGLHPTFLFDTNKIKNQADLNAEFNKHIPVDGNTAGAIQEVQRQGVKSEVSFILDLLDTASQRATGATGQRQGLPSEDERTATESNLIAQGSDARFSLSAKVFGWSEKRFWQQWYRLYKDNFEGDIDEKVIRVHGAMGAKWLPLTRENIITNIDPDVKVESKVVSDSKRFNELQLFRSYIATVATDPTANLRYAFKELGRLHGS